MNLLIHQDPRQLASVSLHGIIESGALYYTLDNTTGSNASVVVTVDIMVKRLQPVEKKRYIIGSKLKLPHRRLNMIVNKHKSAMNSCFIALCEEWVSTFKEAATWSKVVDALKSDLVDEKILACDIEREFCLEGSSNSKTWVSI